MKSMKNMKKWIIFGCLGILAICPNLYGQNDSYQQQRPMQGRNRMGDQGDFQHRQRQDMGRGQNFNQRGFGLGGNMPNEKMGRREQMAMELRESDPEAFEMFQQIKKLEKEARKLAQSYFQTDSPDRQGEIQTELREILTEALTMKFELTERKTEDLLHRLEEMRTKNDDRKMHLDEIVSEYIDRLVHEEMRQL